MRHGDGMALATRPGNHLIERRPRGHRRRSTIALVLVCAALGAAAPAEANIGDPPRPAPLASDEAMHSSAPWAWPGGREEIVRPFDAPDHDYGAGHRGLDVAVSGEEIVAPADGIVAFRGTVVDRPLLTIDHGAGLVSTLEPVASELSPGARVTRGAVVGTLASGGHTPAGALHLGARVDGAYVNPLALLGAATRPILLPCCEGPP